MSVGASPMKHQEALQWEMSDSNIFEHYDSSNIEVSHMVKDFDEREIDKPCLTELFGNEFKSFDMDR